LRAARTRGQRAAPASLSARLIGQVRLEARAGGELVACFADHSQSLGTFGAGAAERAQDLQTGLPLHAFAPRRRRADDEVARLVRRLARYGLLEYGLARSRTGADQVVIEPQMPDYWPQTSRLRDNDALVLSRFAYLRRRGNEIVLESPRAGALFRICEPQIAAVVAALATPQRIKELRRRKGFPGPELFALLLDCQILFKSGRARDAGLRAAEGDANLVPWDFHDLLFHARSTQGRHANPVGSVYPYAGVIAPLPAVRPCWPGTKIDLDTRAVARSQRAVPDSRPHGAEAAIADGAAPAGLREGGVTTLLRQRHSTRSFDDRRPITINELACFLDATARVQSEGSSKLYPGEDAPEVAYALRPYPSGGASYELELYLAVDKCQGLGRGFYHYDAGAHALVPVAVRAPALDALLGEAALAMDASGLPQILITIAARFGRVSWKYSSLAYALILKDVGVLMQTFYLMATEMGLGGCALGTANIDLFAKMTGLEFHVEGPVGQFAIGRGAAPSALD
jgi:SagB-type dehydrogenase family enzyme